jgi:hypothetical protein
VSTALAELYINLIEAFGGSRPGSLGLTELFEALQQAIATFVESGSGGTSIVETASVATTATIDWSVASTWDVTMTGNTTFSFANLTLGRSLSVTLRGQFAPTWPSVAWQPSAPSYSDTGSGMSFEFWVTQVGEIRGAAV